MTWRSRRSCSTSAPPAMCGPQAFVRFRRRNSRSTSRRCPRKTRSKGGSQAELGAQSMSSVRRWRPLNLWACPVVLVSILFPLLAPKVHSDEPARPTIRKLGTLDLLVVETTPVVYRDRLYRFEYVRKEYAANKTGDSYFRFIDVETGKTTTAFASGFDLGCAYADGGAMWVFGVDNWDGENIEVFRSNDLEHWEQRRALKLPGWGLFNTSVCKADDRYVMAIE